MTCVTFVQCVPGQNIEPSSRQGYEMMDPDVSRNNYKRNGDGLLITCYVVRVYHGDCMGRTDGWTDMDMRVLWTLTGHNHRTEFMCLHEYF